MPHKYYFSVMHLPFTLPARILFHCPLKLQCIEMKWNIKRQCTNLEYINKNEFTCGGFTALKFLSKGNEENPH